VGVSALAVALLASSGCDAPSGLDDRGWVDSPELVWASPDSARVGGLTTLIALGCPPGWSVCAGTVRDLHWSVADTSVLRLERRGADEWSTPARGLRVGATFVTAIGRGGRDSTLVRIVP
jgi:hypothetical protein